ncbi:MAG: Coenzyme F420 hydrogenase/dehydrogenase, beta subunit C-terminal domain, partial [Alistipes sp.]|nr:Coenzyme F420 hydrogenase/dehydrogenase, beta subunit C-terminal domain [Alistipes sp.]
TLLAEQVLFEGGVVFGAKFDENWNVVHDYTETIEGLEVFRGSKYVQSTIGDCFIKAKQFLVAGRKVLFSGTPCQIAGLKKYLRKEYSNLLSVDIICHGVPSSMVWKKYLDEIKELRFSACSESVKIEDINFRDKTKGWNNYLCSYYMMNNNKAGILSYNHLNDPYMRLFLTNHSLRPSCYCCPGKAGKSGSDITIGDCWGIGRISKTLNDDKGVGVCVMHNNNDILDTIISSSQHLILSMDYLAKYNKSYYYSSLMPYERKKFFETITSTNSVIFAAKQFAPAKGFITRFVERMTRFVKRHLNH